MFPVCLVISSWKDRSFTGSSKEKSKLPLSPAPLLEISPSASWAGWCWLFQRLPHVPVHPCYSPAGNICFQRLLVLYHSGCLPSRGTCLIYNYPETSLFTSENTTGGISPLTFRFVVFRENQLFSTKFQVQLKVGGEGQEQEEAEIV